MKKQVYTLTKNELLNVLSAEGVRVELEKKYKEIKKIDLLLVMVQRATFETLTVEGVRGNNEGRQMVNAGSLVENLVKHHRKNYNVVWKSFNEFTADEKDGFMNYEIKASLPNARNTALVEPATVILVNATGCYLIKKDVSMSLPVDSQGRYYENVDYSSFQGVRRLKSLSEKLGL